MHLYMQDVFRKGVMFLEHKYSFVIPHAVKLGDVGAHIKPQLYGAARGRIKEGLTRYDRVTITPDQWRNLYELELQCKANLPSPFTCEALCDFCLEITGTDYLVVFQQTNYPEFTLKDGRRVIPKVDCTIGKDKGGQYHLGGIGLISNPEKTETQICYYWVGEVKKHFVAESIVDILSDYFAVQYAFHVLPDRIVEVSRETDEGSANPATAEIPPKAKAKPGVVEPRRHTTPIQRTIYVSDTPVHKTGRKFDYHCNCWYVRGFWRKVKGRDVWVHGYFKGRDRLNESARKSTKNYVLH